MKKRLAAVMLSFTTVLALSGCYPTGKKVNEDISSTSKNAGEDISDTSSDSSHFEYIKDNLTVSFDYPEIPDELPSRIKLKKKMFNRQEMVELFFNGEAPVSEYLYGVNKEYGQYTANDGSELTIEGNSISYINGKISSWESSDKLKFPVSYFSVTNVCKEYMRDIYSITGDEIEGFPLQGALDSAKELISKLGITGYGEPKIYSFSLATYEKMKSNETYMFNDEYPLTKDNEIYIFVFPQLFGKVEVSNLRGVLIKNSADDRGALVDSSSIIVGVSKEGIFELNIDEAYEEDGEVLSMDLVKYDFNHAVTELKDYFDKVNFTKTKTVAINNARVFYFPTKINESDTVEFVPAWSFEGCGTDLDMREKLGHASFWDIRYIVNTDIGVVREYSEV